MTADRNRAKLMSNEHEMIEVQYEIQKLEADLEFHKQKTRLIKNALDEKNKTLETLMQGDAILRKMSEQFRGKFKGEHNEN
jgi:hypothetical protein